MVVVVVFESRQHVDTRRSAIVFVMVLFLLLLLSLMQQENDAPKDNGHNLSPTGGGEGGGGGWWWYVQLRQDLYINILSSMATDCFSSSYCYPPPPPPLSPIHNKLWTFPHLRPLLLFFFFCVFVSQEEGIVSPTLSDVSGHGPFFPFFLPLLLLLFLYLFFIILKKKKGFSTAQ